MHIAGDVFVSQDPSFQMWELARPAVAAQDIETGDVLLPSNVFTSPPTIVLTPSFEPQLVLTFTEITSKSELTVMSRIVAACRVTAAIVNSDRNIFQSEQPPDMILLSTTTFEKISELVWSIHGWASTLSLFNSH